MNRISTIVRRGFLALTLVALGAAVLGTSKAQAQPLPPPPPLNVTSTILKQKVDANTYRAKLRVTAEVPGVAKNTFETGWITLKKNEPKPCNVQFNAMFRVYGSMRWDGSKITATATVEARVGPHTLRRSISASVAAS